MKEYLKKNFILDLFFLLFAYVVLFNQLGRQPIHLWDEGFYAMNALEMSFNNNFLVKYYDGKPEMCATEPPLAAWLQLLSVKAFGYDEAVYRIPSAIAALLVAFLIINFCSEELKNRKLGYFSACILLLSPGYNGYHIARTADLDSLLVLFMFFYAIYFYKYLKYLRIKYFYFAVLGLLLAFFTKSIVSFMFLPPLFIYAIYKKKLHFVFSHKEIYIGITAFLLITCGYYLLRENANPGYINAAWQNEIALRFTKVNEGHHGPFSFYIENLCTGRFSPWFALLPLSLLFVVIRKLFKNDLVIYFSLIVFLFLFVMSCSKTKIIWYDAALYPFLSIAVGYGIYVIFNALLSLIPQKKNLTYLFSICFLIAVFYYPFRTILDSHNSREVWSIEKYGKLIKTVHKSLPQYKSYKVMVPDRNPSAEYYCRLNNLLYSNNLRINYISKTIDISNGDTIMFNHPALYDKLRNEYYYSILATNDEVVLLKVDSLKKTLLQP